MHCSVHMDFSENWVISYPNEPQPAYYSKDPITVHPVVIHHKEGNETKVKTLVLVTDDRVHYAGAIFAFLRVINNVINNQLPNIRFVHYLTDSPTSQYRNAKISSVIAKHYDLFSKKASWSYFESGHGKGHVMVSGLW